MRPAAVPPELWDRPFTPAQARAAGITSSALRGPQWRQVFHGVWVHADVADTRELRLAAARLVLPPVFILREQTAAWVYGADVRSHDDLDVHVYVPPGSRVRERDGLYPLVASLTPEDVNQAGAWLLTSPTRTAFDCLRMSDDVEAVVFADALTHLARTSSGLIATYAASHHGMRGCRVVEARLPDVEPKSESPMETRLRLLLLRAGLPRPLAQWEVRNEANVFVARLDLAWPEFKVSIEYDGAQHWAERRHDDRRRAAARSLGWHVDVVSAEDYYRTPDDIVVMVKRALAARGWRD